ncbi:unnamed protein product, partial [Ixodes pacificus]
VTNSFIRIYWHTVYSINWVINYGKEYGLRASYTKRGHLRRTVGPIKRLVMVCGGCIVLDGVRSIRLTATLFTLMNCTNNRISPLHTVGLSDRVYISVYFFF